MYSQKVMFGISSLMIHDSDREIINEFYETSQTKEY